jgi:glycosyltransferase involved in cell wall biosynthesis
VNTENNTKPLVSIITPSFNQGLYLEETILSVLKQDYNNIEYIIIDGGSTDNSVDIIKKYQEHLSYWKSEKDEGQTHAIIKGFNKAKGKYITWLCSDDVMEPSMVSVSVAFLEANPRVVMTYGNRTRFDAKSNIIAAPLGSQFRPWFLKWGFAIPQETCMIRKEAYDRCGGLDISLQMAMDFDLFCKLSKVGKIMHLPVFMGRFRSHQINKSSLFSEQIKINGFKSGSPLELTMVYKKHFHKNFSVWRWKNISLIESCLRLYDKRKKEYKKIISFIVNVKNS